jgi:hypothetical protein
MRQTRNLTTSVGLDQLYSTIGFLIPKARFLLPLRRTCRVGYFTPVHERDTKWDNIEEHILTSFQQAPLIAFMSLAQRRAA